MRGRKKTPTNLVLLRGNPGKRALNKEEPKPRQQLPEPPGHLDTGAKREWRRVAPELHQLGLLTVLDVDALAIYCVCWSRWVAATRQLNKEGFVVEGPQGPRPSPWLTVANTAAKQMLAMAIEFGMTPSSRARIKVEPPRSPDPFEDLLGS